MPHSYEYVEGFEDLQDEFHAAMQRIAAGEPDWTDHFLPESRIEQPLLITFAELADTISDLSGVPTRTWLSSSRKAEHTELRSLAAFLATEIYPARSLQRIGRLFGGKTEHTTILHRLKRAKALLSDDGECWDLYVKARERLGMPSISFAEFERRHL